MKTYRLITGKMGEVGEIMIQPIEEGWELDRFDFPLRYSKY